MINAAIGGIIIGKISEGSLKDGIKHTVILVSASYIICVFAILPLSIGSDSYDITPVSGDNQTTIAGFKLTDPIVFNVTDKSGNPVPGTQIQFEIKPDGRVDPAFTKTNNSSQATVFVTLGDDQVEYTITARVGSSSGSGQDNANEQRGAKEESHGREHPDLSLLSTYYHSRRARRASSSMPHRAIISHMANR